MSPADAEEYGVTEDERHLYVRHDDAKANVGLVTNKARWFRRVGVTIANGDEVGVLVPDELGLAAGDNDLHRLIIACLLARGPEPEISLNAAARRLAWGTDERFAKYRQSDARGNQRASQTLRDAILTACRNNICIINGGQVRGFTCNQHANPKTLLRFEQPAADATNATPPRLEFDSEDAKI